VSIDVHRVYDDDGRGSGARFLVDRLWPRGKKKEELHLDGWLKDVAPSDRLRRWFGHDPERWDEFVRRYDAELEAHPAAWQPLLDAAKKGEVTLLFGAKDEEHNNAVALKAYLEKKLRGRSLRATRSRAGAPRR
jgi:uncharacterized protein YeaO (DUF488 family)